MQVIDNYPAKRQVAVHTARQTMPLCGSLAVGCDRRGRPKVPRALCRLPKKRPQRPLFLLAPRTLFASLVLAMGFACEKKRRQRPLFLLAPRTLFASLVLAMGE